MVIPLFASYFYHICSIIFYLSKQTSDVTSDPKDSASVNTYKIFINLSINFHQWCYTWILEYQLIFMREITLEISHIFHVFNFIRVFLYWVYLGLRLRRKFFCPCSRFHLVLQLQPYEHMAVRNDKMGTVLSD